MPNPKKINPGEWEARGRHIYCDGKLVLAVYSDGATGTQDANTAKRVAACVNALAGVPIPSEYIKSCKSLNARHKDLMNSYTKVCNSLRALKKKFSID